MSRGRPMKGRKLLPVGREERRGSTVSYREDDNEIPGNAREDLPTVPCYLFSFSLDRDWTVCDLIPEMTIIYWFSCVVGSFQREHQ